MAKRALIVGYYGAGNAGDEAILEAMLGSLRESIPHLLPVVVSEDPDSTALAYNVGSVSNSDRQAVMAAVRDCDFVILGGGGLLADYWDVSLGNFFSPTGALSYSSYAALAALYDKPLILYAIGVGPLATRTGRIYIQMVAEQAQLITVRDVQSKALLEELGIDGTRIHVTADPAFLLPFSLPDLDLPRPILGAALRHWSVGVDPEAWESEVAKALDGFLSRHGGSVLFLPFQRSAIEINNDTATAERIRTRMRMGKSAVVFEGAGVPQELAGAIGRCDLMLGMRYHSVLFALRQAVPTVGLVYDPKVRNLLASAKCEERALDLGGIREENLLDQIERIFAGGDGRAELMSFSHRMSASASENARRVAALLSGEVSNPPAPATCRSWLDEFSGVAAFQDEDGILKSAIHTRRDSIQRERGEPWPYDVVCFPGIEWDYRWMRAQQLMSQFAERGHRVFFVSVAAFLPAGGPKFVTRLLRRNVWEVQLATPEPVNVYSGLMADAVRNALVDDLSALAAEFAIQRAACILHLSTWSPAAQRLQLLLGWRLVYDCMDDWSGFPFLPQALLDKETALVGDSDLVVVSAQKLWDKWSPRNPNTVLIRNAADPAHFQLEPAVEVPVEIPRSCPVIGFFGLIDSWFDVELVRQAATERRQYLFVLIGAVYDKRADELRVLPNVRFLGHQPYELLPAYLRRFDACIIPFKINALTQATDPVKFYEYITQGKPVVSTRMPELEVYREVAYLAEGPEDFVRLLDAAVDEHDPELMERRVALARENSWAARYEVFDSAVERTFDEQARPESAILASPAERQPDLGPVRRSLERILATMPENTTVVIVPPSMPWVSAALSNTARRWARSLAHCGCLVFYSDSQRLAAGENTFTEVETRIFAANAPLEVYAGIKAPIVVATSSNLDQLRHFRDPLVLYECAEEVGENESACMGLCAEWLARAAVVTVSSQKLYESIASQRPDAVLMPESQLSRDDRVPAILERLKSTLAEENDPAHLRAMLAWREQQVHTLWRQIREQNHPAVEILQDAVTELKRVLAERVDGIAFLRSEVAAREKIIDERGQAVEFLKTELAQREGATTFLRHEIESRDEMILERQRAIEFLQREVTAQKTSVTLLREEAEQRDRAISVRDDSIGALQLQTAEQSKGIAFLKGELAQREGLVSERDNAIEGLQQQLAAESANVTFLREQFARQEEALSDRDNGIESLRQQIAAQNASMAFLGEEVAQREGVISEHKNAIEALRKEIAAQGASIAFLQEELTLRDRLLLDREAGIGFLRQEVAARDLAAEAHIEGIEFLRAEVAHRDRIIETLEGQIAGLRESLEELGESDRSRILHGESSAG